MLDLRQDISPILDGWLDLLPPKADVLRDYQRELLLKAAGAMRKTNRILVQAPTGAGKTHLIAAMTAAALVAGLRVLILATRTRLVRQIHERLDQFEIPHGIIAASLPSMANWYRPVQVASVDTLYRRCLVDNKFPLPLADVVIFDEAHLALGDSRTKLIGRFPKAWLFGFTATPAKASGRPLSDQFSALVNGPSVSNLIGMGMLVRPRVFSRPVVESSELDALKQDAKSGDFATGELSELMGRPKLVGDVVQNWLRIANSKRTLVFSVDKAHGASLTREFLQAGIPAEQLTDADDDDFREAAIARLERGDTTVLVNCFLLSYGIDIPLVDCIVLARPTRSVVLYLQAVGRGMRPAPGKDSVIIIDHGRVVESLGLPTDPYGWTLGGENVNKLARDRLKSERILESEKPRTCGECSAVWHTTESGNSCPECGWKHVPACKPVNVEDADLHELDGLSKARQKAHIDQFYRECVGYYSHRWPDRWCGNGKSGRWWAWSKTRDKFKLGDQKMPRGGWEAQPAPVGPEVSGWLKYQQIKWAKSQARAA